MVMMMMMMMIVMTTMMIASLVDYNEYLRDLEAVWWDVRPMCDGQWHTLYCTVPYCTLSETHHTFLILPTSLLGRIKGSKVCPDWSQLPCYCKVSHCHQSCTKAQCGDPTPSYAVSIPLLPQNQSTSSTIYWSTCSHKWLQHKCWFTTRGSFWHHQKETKIFFLAMRQFQTMALNPPTLGKGTTAVHPLHANQWHHPLQWYVENKVGVVTVNFEKHISW